MPIFSRREGYGPMRSSLQIDSMDDALRVGLWNFYSMFYLDPPARTTGSTRNQFNNFATALWMFRFKRPYDELRSMMTESMVEWIKDYFFQCEWYDVYNLVEFTVKAYDDFPEDEHRLFMDRCNEVLEAEQSAWRFVGNEIRRLTSDTEIEEVEVALENTESLSGVQEQLKRSLALLSQRPKPDARNSIKESISAVEGLCKLITGDKKATLGTALGAISRTKAIELHPSLRQAFDKLYGYTSDKGGIRHALLDESDLTYEDARFMLVSCAAFINYLIAKADEAGIDLTGKGAT
jgi:hypothetical protein